MSAAKIGLQKLNIPQAKTASPKAAIANNLRTSTPGASYGIFAQRSLTGSGIHLNNRLFNSPSISATRHALNDNRVVLNNNIGIAPHRCHNTNGNTTMNKFMAGMMAMNMMAQLTAQTVDTIKDIKANNNTKKDVNVADDPALKGKDTNQSTSLTSMKSADSSTTLEAAIQKAQAELNEMPSKIATAKTELTELQGKSSELKAKYESANTDYETNQNSIKETSGKVNELQTTVDTLKNNVDSLKAQIQNSQTPEGLPGPNTAALLERLKQAENLLKQKETELETTQKKLEELKEQEPKLKENMLNTKEEYETNIKNIEAKQDEIKQLESDKKSLEAEIPKQQKRLAEMQKKEEKELTKVETDITKLQGEIDKLNTGFDASDGVSGDETKTLQKVKDKQAKLDELKAKQDKIKTSIAIRNLSTEMIGGKQFKTGFMPDGNKGYFIDGKPVEQSEYDEAYASAKASVTA